MQSFLFTPIEEKLQKKIAIERFCRSLLHFHKYTLQHIFKNKIMVKTKLVKIFLNLIWLK